MGLLVSKTRGGIEMTRPTECPYCGSEKHFVNYKNDCPNMREEESK